MYKEDQMATGWIDPLKFKHIGLFLKRGVARIRKNTNGTTSYSLYMGGGYNPFIRWPLCGQYVVSSVPPLEMS